MRFKYFDHTADVLFESYGKTLAEAFENAGLAMFNILTDIDKVKPEKEFSIEVISDSDEKLLYDFLEELIFLMDTEGILISKFSNLKIKKENNFILTCKAKGDLALNYETHGDIKSPTYNQMEIKKKDKNYVIKAVVDI